MNVLGYRSESLKRSPSGFYLCCFMVAWALGAPAAELVSGRDPAFPPQTSANGDSIRPWISPDGRFVLYSSTANNLVPADDSQLGLDVFLRDRTGNTTTLVSVNATAHGGGNGHSLGSQVSTNGRYVLFESEATNLLVGDTNSASDIFVRDLQVGTTHLVSIAANGGWPNGASSEAVMSPDGRFVAFVSEASNLVAGDTNGIPDLFVRDLMASTTKWVTAGATGANTYVSTPLITPDGRFVAYFSTSLGMLTGVPATTRGEIYRADLLTDTRLWVSTNASATVSNFLRMNISPSYHPSLSADGRFVAFKCGWTNGTVAPPPPGQAATLVFRYDAVNGTSTVLTTNAFAPWQFNDDVFGPEMTPDGRFVAYVEREGTGTATPCSVRLWDELTGTNAVVSVDLNGLLPANRISHTPAVSADGRYITFVSDAVNLVTNALTGGPHIYWRDLLAATNLLVDVNPFGAGAGNQTGVLPMLSPDGQRVIYATDDGSLAPGDANKLVDVFLWTISGTTNELVSLPDPAATSTSGQASSALSQLSLSGNGGMVAFATYASDLGPGDFNGEGDVYVQMLATGSNSLVSVGGDGNAALGGTSFGPLLSADGRYVVFTSAATNLVAGDTNLATDVFRRDLVTGTITCESILASGTWLGAGDSYFPAMSLSGRYLVFVCRTNLATASPALFWRDAEANVTIQVHGGVLLRPPSISADGQRLTYFDTSARLYVWNAVGQTNIYTNATASLVSAVISPDGGKVLYQTANQLWVGHIAYGTNQLLNSSTAQTKNAAPWSSDGRYVAFVTGTSLVPGDGNGTNDVYLRDLQSNLVTLLSVNQTGTASGTGPSDAPTVSADGRFVAFRTFATNLVPGAIRPPSLVLFDRATGSNQLITTGTTAGWSSWVTRPELSTNATTLAFQSWDDGLVAGDRNRAGDAFTASPEVVPLLDSDGDGIPDWWLLQYFGHTNGQPEDESRATDDADDDGLTNLEEHRAGTDPRSADSVLAVRVTLVAGNQVTLNWPAWPGRNYQVLATDDLTTLNWQNVPGATVIGSLGTLTIGATGAQRYFRVLAGN